MSEFGRANLGTGQEGHVVRALDTTNAFLGLGNGIP